MQAHGDLLCSLMDFPIPTGPLFSSEPVTADVAHPPREAINTVVIATRLAIILIGILPEKKPFETECTGHELIPGELNSNVSGSAFTEKKDDGAGGASPPLASVRQ